MEQRTVARFRKRVIWVHWLHTVIFAVMLITGALIFFDLTGLSGGQMVRLIHRIMAVFFVAAPVLYSLFDPGSALSFLKEAFLWNRDDLAWTKSAVSYYFGGREQMPAQDRINGDQKLWQLIVIITGVVFVTTGIILWFFKFKIPQVSYQWVLFTHATAFGVVSVMFLWHFYVASFHPRFEESLSSMLDGKISQPYAREHYSKWYDRKTGEK